MGVDGAGFLEKGIVILFLINWNIELEVDGEALARVRSFDPGGGLSGVTD